MSRRHKAREPSEISSSWRMVEGSGENDSFDTNIVPSLDSANNSFVTSFRPLSSGEPSSVPPSQSQEHHSFASQASQDSIRDFSRHQDDPDNILKQPFRPSMPPSARTSYSGKTARVSDNDLRMPTLDVDDGNGSRRRGSPIPRLRRRDVNRSQDNQYRDHDSDRHTQMAKHRAQSFLDILQDMSLWSMRTFILACSYVQKPIALLLAGYICVAGILVLHSVATRSAMRTLAPICNIPGASLLPLPFCGVQEDGDAAFEYIEFAKHHDTIENVLQKSMNAYPMPWRMTQTENALRDLTVVLEVSNLENRAEFVQAFRSYIHTLGQKVNPELHTFNVRAGGVVDSILSTHNYTRRRIARLDPSLPENQPSVLSKFTMWAFPLFVPSQAERTNEAILLQYIQYAEDIVVTLDDLIGIAQIVLDYLKEADMNLHEIHRLTEQSKSRIESKKGGNAVWNLLASLRLTKEQQKYMRDLDLLTEVEAERSGARDYVADVLNDLRGVKAQLQDLQERISKPGLQLGSDNQLPLEVHLDMIEGGVDRLQRARQQFRDAKDSFIEMRKEEGGRKKNKPYIEATRAPQFPRGG